MERQSVQFRDLFRLRGAMIDPPDCGIDETPIFEDHRSARLDSRYNIDLLLPYRVVRPTTVADRSIPLHRTKMEEN